MPEVRFASSALSSVIAKLLLLVNGFGVIRKVAPPIGLFFSSTFSIIREDEDDVMLLLDDNNDKFLFKEYANTLLLLLSSLPILFAILPLSKLVSSKYWLIKIRVIAKPKNIIAKTDIDSKLKCINLAFNDENLILRKFISYLLDMLKSL